MILVIDNYDSFTYNLVQYIKQIGIEVKVVRNDQIAIGEIERLNPEFILLSPGPGNPDHAGICIEVVKHFFNKIPILGVCLGHQVIAQAFGGKIIKAKRPMHGKTSFISHDGQSIFEGLENSFKVTRYHSLIVEEKSLSQDLDITAKSEDGEIMGIRHRQYKVEGIQFHPEAILTENGLKMIQNFFQPNEKFLINH
ncbi:anthranilate synthase component II [Heyndrickxia oleronia]|jgi:anthranilate synthase/aminodeoxychorismate synthase-like glutamine amidotransferase|uniref:anthranilate synthase component II n=1 Tax=Heyndrickxia oleronia TaxID=38875 RepID=UPI00203F77DB|nr:aminodeoxychorismate/anthranilate synthase component II [Heyndrickxia oleronia]MCI1591010.1 aminodeoxychorismate/anthranilate synthase component II [Heyndrickxia oleronia]MCI1613069.1 aminodeoxychorismate/anthranilate synthase component II [Heyndrickxia oleronia]MCI1761041.1 aminodeoxychorismate/anthranilate synthase component II [Heyndrickxia oleronia]MCM3455140.1 aminodeoxychorismate/anthranilate synthase component II [Heyndrickxia oleronia]